MSASTIWKLWTCINTVIWKDTTGNCVSWLCLLKKQLSTGKERILNLAEERGAGRKACAHGQPTTTNYICSSCSRDYYFRIGLTSRQRCCSSRSTRNSKGTVLTNDRRKPTTNPYLSAVITYLNFSVIHGNHDGQSRTAWFCAYYIELSFFKWQTRGMINSIWISSF